MGTQIATTPPNAVTKSATNTIKGMLSSDAMREQFAKALPKHLTPERFVRVALTALTKTPGLMKCTQESFFGCLLSLSGLGLEPDGRRAHLIPYGNVCTLIVDYKGIVELIMRTGLVSNIHADVVCDADVFDYNLGEILAHKINFREPRGEAYAVYAVCTFKDGTRKSEVMSLDDVRKIQARSKAGKSGPWVTDFSEMAKKTVFKRMAKWLPLSAEYRDALDKDGDVLEIGATSRPVGRPPKQQTLDTLAESLSAQPEVEPEEEEAFNVDAETGEIFEREPGMEG